MCEAHIRLLSVDDLTAENWHLYTCVIVTLYIPEFKMHTNVDNLIVKFAKILDRDPLDQMEDTQSILVRFAQQLATELGEIVVADPVKDGVRMYFDEKIARYVIKRSVGL